MSWLLLTWRLNDVLKNLVVLRTDTITLYTFCSSSLVLKKSSVKETHTIFVYFNSIEKVLT